MLGSNEAPESLFSEMKKFATPESAFKVNSLKELTDDVPSKKKPMSALSIDNSEFESKTPEQDANPQSAFSAETPNSQEGDVKQDQTDPIGLYATV